MTSFAASADRLFAWISERRDRLRKWGLMLALLVFAGGLIWSVQSIPGGPMSWRTSFELTVYTSAANMLPLPGGAIAKLAAMKVHGVGIGRGSAMILLSSAIWGGLAFLY